VIPKLAVNKFLRRELDDWSWYRRLDDERLAARRERLPVDPPIWDRLQRHQKQGVLLGIRLKKLAYFFDTGTGKTLMVLALMRYFEAKGKLTRMLALVPNKVNKEEWAREIEKHCPDVKYVILEGSTKDKWDALEDTDATVVIETYAGFVRMLAKLEKKKRGKGQRLVRDPVAEAKVSNTINMIVCDESGAVGNRESLTYRILKPMMWKTSYAYELNGTPFGRDPTPLWGQMNCLDRGATLGESLTLFRAAFFKEVPNGFGVDYEFRKDMSPELHQMLKNRSLRCKADEADLPTIMRIMKVVALGSDAQGVYDKALASLRKSRGRVVELKNEFVRMRQVSSGFLGYTDDDDGTRAQYEFSDNPKMEMLLHHLTRVTANYKAVVFNEFTFSGSMICRELDKLEIPHTRIYGGTKDPGKELRKFTEDEDCRVLVLQSAAGGMGLNLQCAKYVFYYESPVSPRVRKQTEARVARQGSTHDRVFIYDLVARGVDMSILGFHKAGRDLLQAILNGDDTL
jgi:SNF2 family DNA or RNA helicase